MINDNKSMVSKQLIDGVKVKSLKWILDERGKLMEILRCDDDVFTAFGQVYITTCFPNVVKGWHYHKKQADCMTVIKGAAKIVLYDGRENSATLGVVNEFFVSEDSPALVIIPLQVMHGFKACGVEPAYIINTVTLPYDKVEPDEYRIDPFNNDIPYDWALKQG